jgi:ABC-type molybdate transport system ATPase subunit
VPMLLVEHDIDRVFQIADAVTVMNEGQVSSMVRSRTPVQARRCKKSLSVSGTPTVAASPRKRCRADDCAECRTG